MKLRRYWVLGTRHFFLLCRALLATIYFRMALFVFKYKRLSKSITVDRSSPAPSTDAPSPIVLSWAVRQSARIVPFATCLTQALAVQYLLGRHGEEALIRIGVRTNDSGKMMAHAWVIFNETILIGGPQSNIDRYVVMTDLKPG